MEIWNVLTYRDYDFTDQSGRQVKGRTLHCYRDNTDGWPGVEYAKFAIGSNSPAFMKFPKLGAAYQITFDRYGKVVSLAEV